jgi:hypothetical protein
MAGVRVFCVDRRKCGLGLSCEHGTEREETCKLESLWDPGDPPTANTCHNWEPRKELKSDLDISRVPKIGGRRRSNRLTRSNLILPQPPDLQVSRHIKEGRDIKEDD